MPLPDAERRAEFAVRTLDSASGTLSEDTRAGDWYGLGALAVDWLTEHAGGDGAHVQYWRELATGVAWTDAFEAAFGLTPERFYDRFEAYWPEAVRASRPHLADDNAEPIVVTVGDVPRALETRVRAELARRQRAGDVADFTLSLADAATSPAVFARLRDGREPRRTHEMCSTSKTWPAAAAALALNASCTGTLTPWRSATCTHSLRSDRSQCASRKQPTPPEVDRTRDALPDMSHGRRWRGPPLPPPTKKKLPDPLRAAAHNRV